VSYWHIVGDIIAIGFLFCPIVLLCFLYKFSFLENTGAVLHYAYCPFFYLRGFADLVFLKKNFVEILLRGVDELWKSFT